MTDVTWLITGASSGLGHALAEHVLAHDDRVALAVHNADTVADLLLRYPDNAASVALDVTDADQREAAVAYVVDRFGSLDVLVNNAAVDYVGALEEQDEADIRYCFEVNFFGAVALTRLALPLMRRQRSGTIVNISSMDGIVSLPGNGYYSASKFALEGFTEALWGEIEPLGLRAMLVEPGSFRTGIENRTRPSGAELADYVATGGLFRHIIGNVTPEQFPGDPVRAAAVIRDAVHSATPPHRLVLGSDAQRRITATLDEFRAELDRSTGVALSTDFPGAGKAVL